MIVLAFGVMPRLLTAALNTVTHWRWAPSASPHHGATCPRRIFLSSIDNLGKVVEMERSGRFVERKDACGRAERSARKQLPNATNFRLTTTFGLSLVQTSTLYFRYFTFTSLGLSLDFSLGFSQRY